MQIDHLYQMEICAGMDCSTWNNILIQLSGAHILQSYQWADLKRQNGWFPVFLIWKDPKGNTVAAAVIHKKLVPLIGKITGACLLYSPRGPILDWLIEPLREQVLADLHQMAKDSNAIFIKIDPEIPVAWSQSPLESIDASISGQKIQKELENRGWYFSQDQLQFRNTVLLNLDDSEEEILLRMKQKTRYNIRLAEKKGVTIRPGNVDDLDRLYQMYAQTSIRDGFAIRSHEYYMEVWTRLMKDGIAFPLIAEVEGQVVSAIILFVFGKRGYYFYGMSTELHREKMPNHLLQWQAIRISKRMGCTEYDFWGAPDEFDPKDSMYGVYRFKEGFNGRVLFGLGAWDDPINPIGYRLYTRILPKMLDLMRWLGRKRVAREVVNP